MFEVNDRIKIVKPNRADITATINSIDWRKGAWMALVTRDDTKSQDVFVWHDYQTGISVFKIA